FWHRQLAATDTVIGRRLRVGTTEFTIIGVTPPEFAGTEINATEVWLPLPTLSRGRAPWWEGNDVNGFQILVRPRVGVSGAALEQRMARASRGVGRTQKGDTSNTIVLSSL